MREWVQRPTSPSQLLGTVAAAAFLTLSLAGCQTTGAPDITGSIDSPQAQADAPLRSTIEAYGEKFRANPRDADAALRYGQALRANGQYKQAVAVLEQACILSPGNKALLGLYGRALADNGSYQQAFDVLSRAHTPANPDWRILSIQGTALDQLGNHEEARRYYASALKIVPDEPSVLSNLGMSYVLTKDLAKAESTLRRAYDRNPGDQRVRQNLALAIGLQGRQAEAESIARANVPADQAEANVATLREMLNRDGGAKS